MRRYKKNTLILFEWLDAEQDAKWQSEKDASKRPTDCLTVGFYLNHDKEFLYLRHTISSDEGDCNKIPIGCIKRYGRKLAIIAIEPQVTEVWKRLSDESK